MYHKKFSSKKGGAFSRNNNFRPGGKPFSRGGKKQTGSYIHPSKFINKATITEEAAPFVPEHQFDDFALDVSIKKNVAGKGYVTPTPIQDRAIPHILAGRDVVGIANTGTGKTAAFLLPLINKVLHDRKEQVLIIVPTRELALQIDQDLKGFVRGLKISSVCTVGGMSMFPQIQALRQKNNFIIGTPGRLKDFISHGKIKLAEFQTVVLDEADRMLDMGFVGDMRFVMQGMPAKRHTLFFSATLSGEVEKLIGEFLTNPVRISVKTGDTSKNVEQDIVKILAGTSKFDVLRELLARKEFTKVLVFGRTKHGVERLSRMLSQKGFSTESIHGNKSQGQRQRALGAFKSNQVQVLVATDVAARGLDIAGITHVVNYDPPTTYEDYVHRIGRTGRGEMQGKALTFVE